MTNGFAEAEDKALDPTAISRSVVDHPQEILPSYQSSIIWAINSAVDEFIQWGTNPKGRDLQLRNFIAKESIFASALGTVAARNAAFSWILTGPRSSVERLKTVFEQSDFGHGWESLIIKASIDLYTQDNGAWIEIVREADSPTAALIGLNPLDSQRCYPTGNPKVPCIYQDRLGKWHYMMWYQIIELKEMPSPWEGLYSLQYSALTRLLNRLKIIRNISTYDEEKTGGRFTRAVHLLRGVGARQVMDAIRQANVQFDQQGLMRYSTPVMVSSISPEAEIGHDTIEMATMPDQFNREDLMKWYIAEIALAFGEDYQTFSPLPGGNLGTSSQSQILSAKARGRGPGLFMKLITHALNFNAMPKNVQFAYDEQDLQEEQDQAKVKLMRAQERAVRIKSGEITLEVAQNLAADAGDLTQEMLDSMAVVDITPNVNVNDSSTASSQIGSGPNPASRPPMRMTVPVQSQPDRTTNLTGAPRGGAVAPTGTGEREFVTKPYSGASDSSLPDTVRKMPLRKRRQWVAVFNSIYADTHDEGRAMRGAYSAVKELDNRELVLKQVTHSGVMLALYPPKAVAKSLAIKGKEAADELHVTLMYFGKASEIDESALTSIRSAAEVMSSEFPPISATLGGLGRFYTTDSDGNQAFYASVDGSQVTDLRSGLETYLRGLYRADHGFTAHMTLAYVTPDEPNPITKWTPVATSFDGIHLVVGDEHEIYPFTGV